MSATYSTQQPRVVVIGAGVGGLTLAALLARDGYDVTVLEAQTYPGGCASTFYHKGHRFESGATLAGGFQPNGPHALVAAELDIDWPIHACEPAWVVHLPDRSVALDSDYADIVDKFPQTADFWQQQHHIADLTWKMSAQGLPWPPTSVQELLQLARVGLRNFPQDLRLAPLGLGTVKGWLQRHKLDRDKAFLRFIDAQLLISAQATSAQVNGLYGATALDLARQGVFHVEGGIGGIAETLATKVRELGGKVLYRHRAADIRVEQGCVTGVHAYKGRHDKKGTFFPAEFVVGNLTPWSLDQLLQEDSPRRLQREVQQRSLGSGAFVLHLSLDPAKLPANTAEHHQVITTMEGPMGEGRSIFVSMSPDWDESRAPEGRKAVTLSTHTEVTQWWELLDRDEDAYYARKDDYAERMIAAVDQHVPGFKASVEMVLPGTPVTYEFYTDRHLGMVGGFPQRSLFTARGPKTGIPNLRLVGDSVFPGQSTAGVTLGAMRVFKDVKRNLPLQHRRAFAVPEMHDMQLEEQPARE
jgi:C-3',4' desaturase CrtD